MSECGLQLWGVWRWEAHRRQWSRWDASAFSLWTWPAPQGRADPGPFWRRFLAAVLHSFFRHASATSPAERIDSRDEYKQNWWEPCKEAGQQNCRDCSVIGWRYQRLSNLLTSRHTPSDCKQLETRRPPLASLVYMLARCRFTPYSCAPPQLYYANFLSWRKLQRC